ncbi:hypothetical protein DJICPGNB_08005 [Escherichia coli]|nr:hypothetical protein DJICPGNB_08005 [Escherichia coli]
MSDNMPWKTWMPDRCAYGICGMGEPEETIIEEAEPSLEQQLAQLQVGHERGYQAEEEGVAEGRQQGRERAYQEKGPPAQGWASGVVKLKSQQRQFMPGCSNWSANFKLPLMRLIV